ncbi:MAG TPA: UbiA family prenyltransferase [Chloroflexota bacterium]|nr:UbiA family prenyltransferase [Chloroflexota bacterium]
MRETPAPIRAVVGLGRSVHPFPVLVVVATSTLLLLIAQRHAPGAGLLTRAVLVVFFSQVAIGSLNDFVDRDSDATVQPYKPIPSGQVSDRAVLSLCIASLGAFLVMAASFGAVPLALISAATAAGIAYDVALKPTPFAIVGYFGGFLGLGAWILRLADRLTIWYVPLLPVGAALLVAAYLAQTYPDLEHDRALGHRGLAALLGPRHTLLAIGAAYLSATAAGISGALFVRSGAALAASLAAALMGAGAIGTQRAAARELARRRRLFYLIAPGIACLAAASFLIEASLTD